MLYKIEYNFYMVEMVGKRTICYQNHDKIIKDVISNLAIISLFKN